MLLKTFWWKHSSILKVCVCARMSSVIYSNNSLNILCNIFAHGPYYFHKCLSKHWFENKIEKKSFWWIISFWRGKKWNETIPLHYTYRQYAQNYIHRVQSERLHTYIGNLFIYLLEKCDMNCFCSFRFSNSTKINSFYQIRAFVYSQYHSTASIHENEIMKYLLQR